MADTNEKATYIFSVAGKTYIGIVYDGLYKAPWGDREISEDGSSDASRKEYIRVDYPCLIETRISQATVSSTSQYNINWDLTPLVFQAMLTTSNVDNAFYFHYSDFIISGLNGDAINGNIKSSWESLTGQ